MTYADLLETYWGVSDVPMELEPHQMPPTLFALGERDGWLMLAGRGAGKTFASMRYLSEQAHTRPGLRARIIAPTLDDAVNSCVMDSRSGLLKHDRAARLVGGTGGTRVMWPNDSTCWLVGTPTLRDVDRLRALTNIDIDFFEEAAANPMLAKAVEQAGFSRRSAEHTAWVATTTPRPVQQIRDWLEDKNVAVTRATSFDNPHLEDQYREGLHSIEGTRQWRQEAMGEILMDAEGARWQYEWLDRSRVHEIPAEVDRWVVGVDPASGSGTTGIVAVCRGGDGHLYVTDDASVKDATPEEWAAAVVRLADYRNAVIVAEDNQGGRMVKSTIENTGTQLPVKLRRATVSKEQRADPIALWWEKQPPEAHMVGVLPMLEDQLVSWAPYVDGRKTRESPDRLDAMVWACTWLRDPDKGVVTANPATVGIASTPSGLSGLRGRSF